MIIKFLSLLYIKKYTILDRNDMDNRSTLFYAVKELLILICKLTNWFCFDSRVMCIWIAWLDPFQVFSLEKFFHYIWHISHLSTSDLFNYKPPYFYLSFPPSCLLIAFLNIVFALQPIGDLGTLDVDKNGEAFYTGVKQQLRVADLIGRSIAVYETEDKSDQGLTAAVIARSAGAGENYKKICACDGTTIWEASDKDFVTSNVWGFYQNQYMYL